MKGRQQPIAAVCEKCNVPFWNHRCISDKPFIPKKTKSTSRSCCICKARDTKLKNIMRGGKWYCLSCVVLAG